MNPGAEHDDPTGRSVDRRVETLLERMTLAEKAAQLGSVNAEKLLDDEGTLDEDAVEEGPYEFRVGHSASDIAVSAAVEVTATKEVPATGRTYFATTDVETDG